MLGIKYLFVALCLFILMRSSCVCASDVNDTIDMNTEISNINVTSLDMSNQPVNATSSSFDELKSNIESLNPGDVLNIHKNYSLDNDSNAITSCITVKSDNITINGNGHYINGNNHPVSFKITGNNVKITGLNFCNCQGNGKTLKVNIEGNTNPIKYTNKSPVYWTGNNGIISDCIFSKNTGVNGGAVTWMGNNGTINNVTFENNKAQGAGGAIYLSSENNNICNCVFINSTSPIFNESVFLDNKHKSCNISKNYYTGLFLIDGSQLNIDAENLCKSYYSQFAQKEFNIVPIIYSSLFGINQLDNETIYYGQYFNETHTYKLSIVKNFKKYNITYEMDYIISVDDLKNVFSSLMSNFYKINLKIIKTANINTNDTDEYNKVCSHDVNYYILNTSFMDYVRNDTNISNLESIDYILNVNYGNNSYFSSNAQWMENSGFNITVINGNNATIHATSSSSDENKWIVNHDNNRTFFISNLTIEGFNTVIENLNGSCVFNNVLFQNNKKDYTFQRDDGAALINAGLVICNNCTFINNYAKNGGAVFNQGMLILENTTFKDNIGYRQGNDVLNVDQGIVILNNKIISGSEGNITYVKSISTAVSTIIAGLAIIATAAVASTAVVCTFGVAGFVMGTGLAVGASTALGAGLIFGSIAANMIASNQYNLQFNRITTTVEVIASCVIAGTIAAAITSAIYKPSPSNLREGFKIPYASSNSDDKFIFEGKEYKIFNNAASPNAKLKVFKQMKAKGYIPEDPFFDEIDYVSIRRDLSGYTNKIEYIVRYKSGKFNSGFIGSTLKIRQDGQVMYNYYKELGKIENINGIYCVFDEKLSEEQINSIIDHITQYNFRITFGEENKLFIIRCAYKDMFYFDIIGPTGILKSGEKFPL
ncbi:hypothetical protein [uncultured Methanobrevibacter sp.]|uniref:hypothetical protein n=1 Tax=uncultured Methanobrevibacter sp. TaxID=253161 RepID=UPI0025FC51F3|nr:hypothetical protein [uncultured Methanobrevibacter sp.]